MLTTTVAEALLLIRLSELQVMTCSNAIEGYGVF